MLFMLSIMTTVSITCCLCFVLWFSSQRWCVCVLCLCFAEVLLTGYCVAGDWIGMVVWCTSRQAAGRRGRYMHTHAYMHMNAHTHTHTHTHTSMHTHTHTHIICYLLGKNRHLPSIYTNSQRNNKLKLSSPYFT